MDAKTQTFLVFSAVLLVGLVLYMMYRPKRHPSRLKLSQETSGGKGNLRPSGAKSEAPPQFEEGEAPRGARSISVIFQFNGHDFEAYEALGLPAGSPRDEVEKAYKKALSESPSESREFFDLAYNSILQTLV